jgi:hypothetical protein
LYTTVCEVTTLETFVIGHSEVRNDDVDAHLGIGAKIALGAEVKDRQPSPHFDIIIAHFALRT